MNPHRRGKINYTSVVATLALVVALSSGAYAVSKIGPSDIANNAVRSKHIQNRQVKAADIKAQERFHVVGRPGEPQFFDGGEDDCMWTNGITGVEGTAQAGFARDVLGRVHLRGLVTVSAGSGGDGICDQNEPDEGEDGLVFVLPRAYQPASFDVSGLANGIVIAPKAGAVLSGKPIPPGGVYSALDGLAVLDGVSFRAAPTTSQAASSPARISLRELKRLRGK